jgi:hypothetical protein
VDYNTYFEENVFGKFAEQTKKLNDEKFERYLDVTNKFNKQIFEMEFLLKSSGI